MINVKFAPIIAITTATATAIIARTTVMTTTIATIAIIVPINLVLVMVFSLKLTNFAVTICHLISANFRGGSIQNCRYYCYSKFTFLVFNPKFTLIAIDTQLAFVLLIKEILDY